MRAQNQSQRVENAENMLEDLIEDGAELLALERMMELTTPVAVSKKPKKKHLANASTRTQKPSAVQRGKLSIQPATAPFSGYIPSGFHRPALPSQSHNIGATQSPYTGYGAHRIADDSFDVEEQPLDDDSQLLVPIFRGGKDDAERIRQLLYSDEDMRRTNSEINLSSISDLISESEVSAESFLDWDVVDEMVAMLSNRELSTPSTVTG
ncbi:hypothetical protein EB796_018817 [Bugula neritina]|uniref:Uncharacterized protein n=1 Tax=Bugula neritina TaxID=10212 RepID=A0A7J7JA41_BUGNE|nr:hypothetical protein EB796_018817 [Bugula neritina]